MRTVFLVLVYLLVNSAFAQLAEPLVFQEKIHDFGNIREEAGNADHEFTFTNNSGRTISIVSVQASCGCTTPGWTKEPIAQGREGFIKASYNPLGRPGFFNKSLTVTTDLNGTPIVLQIKGQVVTKEMESDVSRLTAKSGSLMLKSTSFNLGKVYINKPPVPAEFKIFNPGDKTITFSGVVSPGYLQVKTPESLGPNESGVIQLLFNAHLKNQYGFISEGIELITDDAEQPSKMFAVYATIEEYFPPLSETETGKAPVLNLQSDQLDFNVVKVGTAVQKNFIFRNTGKQDLLIRAIQPNCSCISATVKSQRIKAGDEAVMSIVLTGQGRKGTQHKAITIYSNDPANPVQRISLVAVVD
jgi:Protein of unknown function (DUF1573)